MAGMDPMYFLRTEDTMERAYMMAIAAVVFDQQEKRDHNLAVQIVNGVGKMFS
jgi:hypothetical protein